MVSRATQNAIPSMTVEGHDMPPKVGPLEADVRRGMRRGAAAEVAAGTDASRDPKALLCAAFLLSVTAAAVAPTRTPPLILMLLILELPSAPPRALCVASLENTDSSIMTLEVVLPVMLRLITELLPDVLPPPLLLLLLLLLLLWALPLTDV